MGEMVRRTIGLEVGVWFGCSDGCVWCEVCWRVARNAVPTRSRALHTRIVFRFGALISLEIAIASRAVASIEYE